MAFVKGTHKSRRRAYISWARVVAATMELLRVHLGVCLRKRLDHIAELSVDDRCALAWNTYRLDARGFLWYMIKFQSGWLDKDFFKQVRKRSAFGLVLVSDRVVRPRVEYDPVEFRHQTEEWLDEHCGGFVI